MGGLLLLALGLISSCESETVNKDNVPNRDINAVMQSHTAELMAIPGVVGVAVGETDDRTPCIMVLILEEKDEILSELPKELEGHPVCPFVSGEIKPMQDG
jgi:hypothetical protein